MTGPLGYSLSETTVRGKGDFAASELTVERGLVFLSATVLVRFADARGHQVEIALLPDDARALEAAVHAQLAKIGT